MPGPLQASGYQVQQEQLCTLTQNVFLGTIPFGRTRTYYIDSNWCWTWSCVLQCCFQAITRLPVGESWPPSVCRWSVTDFFSPFGRATYGQSLTPQLVCTQTVELYSCAYIPSKFLSFVSIITYISKKHMNILCYFSIWLNLATKLLHITYAEDSNVHERGGFSSTHLQQKFQKVYMNFSESFRTRKAYFVAWKRSSEQSRHFVMSWPSGRCKVNSQLIIVNHASRQCYHLSALIASEHVYHSAQKESTPTWVQTISYIILASRNKTIGRLCSFLPFPFCALHGDFVTLCI